MYGYRLIAWHAIIVIMKQTVMHLIAEATPFLVPALCHQMFGVETIETHLLFGHQRATLWTAQLSKRMTHVNRVLGIAAGTEMLPLAWVTGRNVRVDSLRLRCIVDRRMRSDGTHGS